MIAHGRDSLAGHHGQRAHKPQHKAVIIQERAHLLRQRNAVAGVGGAAMSALHNGAGIDLGILGIGLLQNLLIVDPAAGGQNAGPAGDGKGLAVMLGNCTDDLAVLHQNIFHGRFGQQFHPQLFALGNQELCRIGAASGPSGGFVGRNNGALVGHIENIPAWLVVIGYVRGKRAQPVKKASGGIECVGHQLCVQLPVGVVHIFEEILLQLVVQATLLLPLAVINPVVARLNRAAAQEIRLFQHCNLQIGKGSNSGRRSKTSTAAAQYQYVTGFIHDKFLHSFICFDCSRKNIANSLYHR